MARGERTEPVFCRNICIGLIMCGFAGFAVLAVLENFIPPDKLQGILAIASLASICLGGLIFAVCKEIC